jgi:hypothetical protein
MVMTGNSYVDASQLMGQDLRAPAGKSKKRGGKRHSGNYNPYQGQNAYGQQMDPDMQDV